MPVTNLRSKWVDGDLVWTSENNTTLFTFKRDGTILLASGAVLDASSASLILPTNLRKGFIPLDIFTPRIISSNAIPNLTEAGIPDGNTAGPKIERINGATDKGVRLVWAASEVNEIQFPPIPYPPDLDDTAALTVNLLAKMAAGGMDTPVIAVAYFEGVGDTNAGGNTAALSTTLAKVSVTIAAGDVGVYPKAASISLTPGTHSNEAIELYAAWLEYTKKIA